MYSKRLSPTDAIAEIRKSKVLISLLEILC